MALNGSSQQAASTKRNERSLSPITSRLKRMRHEASKAKYIELPSGEEKSLNRTRISSREHDHSTGNTSTAREHISKRQKEVDEPPKFSSLDDWCKDVEGDLTKSEQYTILIRTISSAMEEELEKYKEDPQSHPQYPAEWDKFWEKRSNDLEADGQDPYKHNFTAEWSVFFMNRINELHEADMKRKKLDVRVILGMTPMSSSTTTTLKKSNYQAAERSSTDQKLTFSSILSNGDTSRETNSENHGEKIPVSIKNIPCGKRKLASIADDDEIIDMDDDDDTLSVISVLRLLTAFEDMLGSLGPKVVDLLSQAVAMEKKRPNLSNKLLMSSENSVFLDTVKEKLKGLIIAGMVQSKQEQTVRKAIRNVSDIVRVIDSKTKEQSKVSEQSSKTPRRARSDDSTPVQNQSNHIPCTNPSPSSSEKSSKRSISEAEQRSDVLKQLETSFVLQGREVLKQHLEELVDVYLANHSSSDTPYLFGLEMGKRLAKMEKAAEVAASFRNIDLKTPPVALPNIQQHKRDDQLRMSNYGSTSSDQQHSFVGGSPFQQQSKHQVQTSGQNGDNLGWMSSSAYGIGDIDNQKSGSQTNHQSGKESKMQKCIQMPSNKYCWQSSQMRYIQQSYQQPVSQYSNASYGSDPANGVPPRNGNEQIRSSPWKPSISHSEFPYQGNQQQSQGQPHFQLQQNTYCQRPNFNMGHQTPYRVQTPMNHNIPPGVNQALLQAPQHRGGQWWPNAAGM